MKTDLEGLSCDKLIDGKDVFYGLTCKYEALKGEIGQKFKMLVIARNGAGYEVEDYAYFELLKPSLEVKSEAVIKVASGESVTLNPSQWKKDGILDSNANLLYIGKLQIDGFSGTEKHLDESQQYVTTLDGVLSSDKVGSEFSGVVVVGDSSQNYVEVKVIIQIVEAVKADSSSPFVIDEKVDSKEVQQLKSEALAVIEEISKKIDYVASIEVKSEEEQKNRDQELDNLKSYLAEVQAKHLAVLEAQQAKEKAAQEWVIDEAVDSKEIMELKARMQSVIADVEASRAAVIASGEYEGEKLASILAEHDAKIEYYARVIRVQITSYKAADQSEWLIDEKVDSEEVVSLKKDMIARVEKYSNEMIRISTSGDYSLEDQEAYVAKYGNEITSYAEVIRAKILELQAVVVSEWEISAKDSAQIIELKNGIQKIISDYAARDAEMREKGASEEELAKLASDLDAQKEKYRSEIARIQAEEAAPAAAAEDTSANDAAYAQALALQSANPGSKVVSALRGMNPCPYTGILNSVEPTAKSISILGCTNAQVANPTGDINSGWMGYFVYNVTY